ncbi:MAG: TadE family protein [Limimaricola soesokkakensis]|uniref:TadE family protein n=1 Tax=Limimaricola soesokkakensis TaxID=1343159 RepID=UPI00405968DE
MLNSGKNDDGGSATVEFVLWVPVAVFLLLLTVDRGRSSSSRPRPREWCRTRTGLCPWASSARLRPRKL